MGLTPGTGRAMHDFWSSSAAIEGLDLPKGEFVMQNCKAYKRTFVIAAAVTNGFGLLMLFLAHVIEVALVAFAFGLCLLLLLPTLLSYRCFVDKTRMQEEYFLLFFKRKKEILWDDVKYRRVSRITYNTLKLYDENKKCLISFETNMVGYDRVLSLAKRSRIQKLS